MVNVIKTRKEDDNVIISNEDFEELIGELDSLKETIEILSDEDLMEQIRNSEKDIKEGRVSDVRSADDLRRLFLE